MKLLASTYNRTRDTKLLTVAFDVSFRLLPNILAMKEINTTWTVKDGIATCIASATDWNKLFNYCPQYCLDGLYCKSKEEYNKIYNKLKEAKDLLVDFLPTTEEEWESINYNKEDSELQDIAEFIYDCSRMISLESRYHIPFEDEIRNSELGGDLVSFSINNDGSFDEDLYYNLLMKVSASICFGFSNKILDYTLQEHLETAEKLITNGNLDVFKHQAISMNEKESSAFSITNLIGKDKASPLDDNKFSDRLNYATTYGICDNYKGFINFKYKLEKL